MREQKIPLYFFNNAMMKTRYTMVLSKIPPSRWGDFAVSFTKQEEACLEPHANIGGNAVVMILLASFVTVVNTDIEVLVVIVDACTDIPSVAR